MKYLILLMALMSAFFLKSVFASQPDLTDLRSPKQEQTYCVDAFGVTGCGQSLDEAKKNACDDYSLNMPLPENTSERFGWANQSCESNSSGTYRAIRTYFDYCQFCDGKKQKGTQRLNVTYSNVTDDIIYSCPPQNAPLYKIPVPLDPPPEDPDAPTFMCAKPLEEDPEPEPEPDPNDKCDEFGNNSMLPPKAGVGSEGQNACYTNPSNGLSCQYVQGGDNFTATGKQCTGDENDYGDRPTPEPPPDGADPNCYNYGSQGQVLICDVDPNEGCNPLTINGTTQYQCPHGCGSIDGVYFCSYDDKDGDGIPDDKNGNGVPDKDETCVNGKCKPNTPDDTTPPTTEKPDMTETNTRLDGVIGELDSIGGKINKTNQTLDGINSGVQGLKQGQDKANGLLAGMSKDTGLIASNTDAIAGNTKGLLETVSKTDIGNTFNPDLSTGFYESSYENGFEGIWAEKSILFEQTETIQFLQQFRFNAGGSPPDTQLCFNMGGSMDFGCADLPIPSPQLLAILKIFILITAAFLCRALIFGG